MTTKTFRLFSTETGHDFGTWQGVDAADVLAQMAEQAGAEVDASIVEAIELTAESFNGKRADFALRVISPRGETVESVKAEQDFEMGETTFRFADGTAIVVDDTDVRRLDSDESDADDVAQWCRDAEGNRLDVGDAVVSVGAGVDDERGEIRELRPDGTCLVAWQQGVVTPADCSALRLEE